MASQTDIDAATLAIDDVWESPPSRNAIYGNALKSVTIEGIRGLKTSLEFTWPVVAIAGVNGTGKTTVLQVCSTAYTKDRGGRYFTLGQWVRGALSGETPPIGTPARFSFAFWDTTPSYEVEYSSSRRRWTYPRRGTPQRRVEFFGITTFAPRIERKDRFYVFRSTARVVSTVAVDDRITESVSRILDTPYSAAKTHTVQIGAKNWETKVPQITKGASSYTEPHMGAGEQKVVGLVQALESLPRQSLVILEEPELTLHPNAQRGLAWYLMAVSKRLGHQILIATHSAEIFEALPDRARLLLIRNGDVVEALHKAPYLRAAQELAGSVRSNRSIILVEDALTETLVAAILRRSNRALLKDSAIVPVGGSADVLRLCRQFRSAGLNVVGIRDADTSAAPADHVFCLPGSSAPEAELLEAANIERAEAFEAGLKDAVRRAESRGLGFGGSERSKRVFEAVANELGSKPEIVVDRLALAWVQNHEVEIAELATRIASSLGRA